MNATHLLDDRDQSTVDLAEDVDADVAAGLAGDDPELDALVDRFAHRVRYFAQRVERRYGLGPAWRDDLVSAGYFGLLKALRNRRAEAHEHELSAYVSKRVEGAVLDEARQVLERASTRADFDPTDLEDGIHVDLAALDLLGRGVSDPEKLADGRGRWRQIEGSLGHLDETQRGWLLAVASGHSLAEIARHDGSSPARLQNQMSRITRSVRAHTPELRRLLRHEI
jgi:RNA polymerase sigma factor (sigma-70 family)